MRQNYGYEIIFHGWTSNHKKWIIKICKNLKSTNIDHGTVDKLQTKIKLLQNENKLLKDEIKNKHELIDSILEHNSNLIHAQNAFAQNHSVTRKINDESISHTNTNNVLRNDKKKKMIQTSQMMVDLKNFKLVLKIFILRLINRK